ncbi:phosphoribosyl-ATP diphosphatase [Corticibacter populi]|uniref:Phosphoribosyl-ATP pyrophosphatase n=1 Tax=Corticibacter populi TaxID=1550736 RepID=A0A3M6QZA1_9BURK|nr:phosphoribosyl-ATP diphosphatase [Corticibacter populi]RMX08347.1 phosphoribosyl-ATP diphosphatase [Corticibacter populi]RZS35640.1 phosphoribosyl-ATP pyrophosphatase [Corticibacter populi]
MTSQPQDSTISADALFAHLTRVLESRKPARGGDPASSYVAKLLADGKAPDAFLKKIGEEAAEVIMAAKDLQDGRKEREALVYEVADLWFHTLVALTHFNLGADDVVRELARREGVSGLAEKAARPLD